jgi:hypothetical protein
MHPLIAHQQNGKCREVAMYTMYWDMDEVIETCSVIVN